MPGCRTLGFSTYTRTHTHTDTHTHSFVGVFNCISRTYNLHVCSAAFCVGVFGVCLVCVCVCVGGGGVGCGCVLCVCLSVCLLVLVCVLCLFARSIVCVFVCWLFCFVVCCFVLIKGDVLNRWLAKAKSCS